MLYTKLTNDSLQQILEQFDIAPIVEWAILEGGSANTNHILKTTYQKYVLTICESKTFEATTSLVNLLKHLETHGFRTTKVVSNKLGQGISFFNNKPVILKEYIEGKVLNSHTDEVLKRIGQSIGQLHLIPVPNFLPKLDFFGQKLLPELKNKVSHPFVDWLEGMDNYIKKNIKTDLPKALIHQDIFFNNIVIDDQNQPIIFDFEEATHYYRIYDIGMAIIGLCNEKGKVNFSKVDKLIEGYEQVITLQTDEKELLKLFICYAATYIASWRFRQFHVIAPTPSRQNTYLEMKEIADNMRYELL